MFMPVMFKEDFEPTVFILLSCILRAVSFMSSFRCLTSMMLRSVPRIASRLSAIRPAVPAARTLHSTRVVYADAEAATGLTFNFTLPAESLYENTPVEMVILPGSDGQFGVMPNHVPTVTQLKPGVVSVQEEAGGPLKKFFISGGFAYVTPESVLKVATLECADIDDIDADAVKVGLAQFSEAYASATDDLLKSEAEIGVEVYSALSHALADGK